MRKACAWCGKVLQDGPEPTSHGICHYCRMLYWPTSIRNALPSGRKPSCDGCSGHKYVDYTYASEPNGYPKRKRGWVCEYRPGWCQLEGRVI